MINNKLKINLNQQENNGKNYQISLSQFHCFNNKKLFK
jgi:hypothetical protein